MDSSDGDAEAKVEDPVAQITNRMEDFYDDNYEGVQLVSNSNFFSERVWNVSFDQTYDSIYIFMARIELLGSQKMVRFKLEQK